MEAIEVMVMADMGMVIAVEAGDVVVDGMVVDHGAGVDHSLVDGELLFILPHIIMIMVFMVAQVLDLICIFNLITKKRKEINMKKQIKYLMLLLVTIGTVLVIDARGGGGHGGGHMGGGHGGGRAGGMHHGGGMGRGGRGYHHGGNYGRGYGRHGYGYYGGGWGWPVGVGLGLGAGALATAGLVDASYNRNYDDSYYNDSYNSDYNDDSFTTYPNYGFSANNGNNPSYEY